MLRTSRKGAAPGLAAEGAGKRQQVANKRMVYSGPAAAFLVLLCGLAWGSAAGAQDRNAPAGYPQPPASAGGAQPGCYLGPPGLDDSNAAAQGWYAPGGYASSAGAVSSPGDSATPAGNPFRPAPQQLGQDTLPPSQPAIPADQIIAILQQAPGTLLALKSVAGQEFGVDPLMISDSGIYNCIQQDARVRDQAVKLLEQRGYVLNRPPGAPAAPQNPWPASNPAHPGHPAPAAGAEPPSELRRLTPVPYPGLPSLPELYSQDVAAGDGLRRFGSDAFAFGAGNLDLLPMDLPVGPDYVLGPGDELIVNLWGGASARLSQTVDRQGLIALPEAGTVAVAGLNLAQAQSAMETALGRVYREEHVGLSLGRVRTVRIYVVGDVQRPGAYDVSSLSTPLNALYAAGGPTSRGSLRVLEQYRGQELMQRIDLYEFLLHGVRSSLDRVHSGDTILVPAVGAQVAVAGMVRRPAVYELKGEADLKTVLDLAGGVLTSADLQEIRVERVVAHERRTMLRVQVSRGAGDPASVPAFAVQDGDFIEVSPILPYNDRVVYLEGHVFKPGRYAWREGMTVSDLLHSYQDVMPEPASRAEVVRLAPPDLHPQTLAFDLAQALGGDDPVTLQPFDTVRVFGRYEFDPPQVSIYGPVLRPGAYPMSKGMTAAALVRMAGGFRRSAYRELADLSSYTIENGERVLLRHTTVALGRAVEGDPSADAELRAGDVVGVRELSGWNDIGAAITVRGEVGHAGTYGIEAGERLSSVLRRAGGFRADAYPEGATLLRVQVREMEEINRQEMIRRLETSVPAVSPAATGAAEDQLNQLRAMRQQQQEVLAALRSHPSSGRQVIKISAEIGQWENTPADIALRPGDELQVPKRPDFVLVTGQVYNATGITYRPNKDAGWYLRQAGGVTRSGDRRQIFILRADGSVIGGRRATVFSPGLLSMRMRPGDSIIVPEKLLGGSLLWRNLLGTAQIMSSVAVTGAVAGVF